MALICESSGRTSAPRPFFFESADRRYKLVGAFAEVSDDANAYRGELLGLMALHLILLAVNKINPTLDGSVTLHSDCLGAISRVKNSAREGARGMQTRGCAQMHLDGVQTAHLPSRSSS